MPLDDIERRGDTAGQTAPEAAASRPRFRLAVPGWARILISVALIAFLAGQIDLGATLAVVAGADPALLAVACMVGLTNRLVAAYRWYNLVRGRAAGATIGAVFRAFFVSSFVGSFLPGGIGVEIARVYTLTRSTADTALSVASVMIERVMALIALVVMVLVGLLIGPSGMPGGIAPVAWIGLAALLAGCALVVSPAARPAIAILAPGRWLAPVHAALGKLIDAFDGYKRQRGLLAATAALTVLNQLLRIAVTILIAWALGVDVSPYHFLVILPVVIFVTLLPISIGGLGVREAGFVYLFGLAGVGAEQAFTLSLMGYAILLAATLPGAWFCAFGGAARRANEPTAP